MREATSLLVDSNSGAGAPTGPDRGDGRQSIKGSDMIRLGLNSRNHIAGFGCACLASRGQRCECAGPGATSAAAAGQSATDAENARDHHHRAEARGERSSTFRSRSRSSAATRWSGSTRSPSQDYLSQVPGLSLEQSRAPVRRRLVLRGVNTGGVSSTVAVYVDETPFGSSTGLVNGAVLAGDFDTFDLARIEVLRGPQGTLYGASSLGGVLKFVTNTPELGRMSARAGAPGWSSSMAAARAIMSAASSTCRWATSPPSADRASTARTPAGSTRTVRRSPTSLASRCDSGRQEHQRERSLGRPRLRLFKPTAGTDDSADGNRPAHRVRRTEQCRGRSGMITTRSTASCGQTRLLPSSRTSSNTGSTTAPSNMTSASPALLSSTSYGTSDQTSRLDARAIFGTA